MSLLSIFISIVFAAAITSHFRKVYWHARYDELRRLSSPPPISFKPFGNHDELSARVYRVSPFFFRSEIKGTAEHLIEAKVFGSMRAFWVLLAVDSVLIVLPCSSALG